MTYIVQLDVEQRMTSALVRQIYDDDGSGALGASELAALTDIIADAENLVEESIRKTYGETGLVWLRAQTTSAPRSVKRRCLDAVRMYIAERHPEYIRIDIEMGWKRVKADLAELRVREVELAVIGSPEPGVNEGATVQSGDPDSTTPLAKAFLDGTGIF